MKDEIHSKLASRSAAGRNRRLPTQMLTLLSCLIASACTGAAPPETDGAGGAGSGSPAGGAAGLAGASSGNGGSSVDTVGGSSSLAGSLSASSGAGQGGSGGSSVGGVPSGGGAAGSGGGGGAIGVGGASSLCSSKHYKLCEDFETGPAGGLPTGWMTFKGYEALSPGDVVVAADEAHAGHQALKSSSQKRGATRAQKGLSGLGETAYHHWGRLFYKVAEPSPRPSGYFHTTFVSLVGPNGENRVVDSVESPAGKHQWLFNVPSDSCCTSSSYNWQFDAAWHCAEWYLDATAHDYRFYHDGVEVPIGFMNRGGAPMSEYTSIVLGATYYQSSNIISSPFTIWFDDLAIDDQRVGCE